MSTHFDAVIVGAGPAGALAAYELARGGARVALLERERLPRYKTCGGGVVARALDGLPARALATFESSARVAELHLLKADGSERAFRARRETPLVSLAMRSAFDHALVEAARDAGALVFEECRVESLKAREDGVSIATARDTFEAAFVIGADGATGITARAAGFTRPLATSPALEWEVRVPDEVHARFASSVRFDFGCIDAGYGWVFAKREHLSVGILSMRRGQVALAAQLERYLARIGVAPLLSVESHGFVIPLAPRREGFARGRVLLVGDAAGLADSLTAEGIGNALRSGRAAARALLAGGAAGDVRSAYGRELAQTILPELAWSRRLARVVAHAKLRDWVLERFGDGLVEAMARVIAGEARYGELLVRPSSWFALARGKVVPNAAGADPN